MPYSHFTYKKIRKELGIEDKPQLLFTNVLPIEPSKWLQDALERNRFFYFFSEKSRSEGIVINVISEICMLSQNEISLYSGAILLADIDKGLNGECDFILAKGQQSYELNPPLFCLIEAEDNDIEKNIPQCIAQMKGAMIYNEQEGISFSSIYGCVTTGAEWQFLKLTENICYVDSRRYYLSELPLILGVMKEIVTNY